MKKIVISFCVLVSLALLLFACSESKQKTYIFRLGHVANEDHTWHQAFEYFGEILKERSDGQILLEVFPSEQLGKEVELIRSIRAGIADMTITGGTLQNWSGVAAFSDMPFLLRDSTHLKTLVNSNIGKGIEQTILNETGLRVVANIQRGPRHLTSNRPIKTPDDLKGIIIRVPNVPSYVTAWSALGAKPTPMAFSEVFTSLQQGAIEGQENPLAMIRSANFSEVQDYLNLTSHVVSWGFLVVGEQQFQSLPENLQSIFLQAAKDTQAYEHKLFLKKELLLKTELKNKGMNFIEVDNKSFQEIGSSAVYESLDPDMKKIYEEISNL